MTDNPYTIDISLLHCLADNKDPLLRFNVLKNLLDYPDDDPDIVSLRGQIPQQKRLSTVLSHENGQGRWGNDDYEKYKGTIWVLYHCAQLGVPDGIPEICRGVESILSTAKPVSNIRGRNAKRFENCKDGVYWDFPLACFTAINATILSTYGHPSQPITRAALSTCKNLFIPGEGFDCYYLEQSLLPGCVMAIVKVLEAYLAVPDHLRTDDDTSFIHELADLLEKYYLYRYIPMAAKEWRTVTGPLSASERRQLRDKWIKDGRATERKEKAGWLLFGFPHHYNTDLLEVLLLLGKADRTCSKVIEEGLTILASKRDDAGMWRMETGLNGKMWVDLDKKGVQSPWITFRALLAFKRFGKLLIQ